MGEVYKAHDGRLNRTVAIKRMIADDVSRFQSEARAIAAINHPHICQIYDVGPDYLVLEYLQGEALGGPVPQDEAVRLASQIADALDAAHGRGILHRLPSVDPATDSGVRAVAATLGGMAGRAEEDEPRIRGTCLYTAVTSQRELRLGRRLRDRRTFSEFLTREGCLDEARRASEGTSGGNTAALRMAVATSTRG